MTETETETKGYIAKRGRQTETERKGRENISPEGRCDLLLFSNK